jgi:hypothetical protein
LQEGSGGFLESLAAGQEHTYQQEVNKRAVYGHHTMNTPLNLDGVIVPKLVGFEKTSKLRYDGSSHPTFKRSLPCLLSF